MINDIMNDLNKVSTPSYLPSWVIKMREKIEVSRLAHTNTEERLQGLHEGMDALTIQLNITEKSKKENFNKIEKSQLDHGNSLLKPIKKTVLLYFIPSEVLLNIFEYLYIEQIIRMDILSKTMRNLIYTSRYWKQCFILYCPHLTHTLPVMKFHTDTNSTGINTASMIILRKYLYDCNICISFLQTMKDQRCIPKHRSIHPHRYSRQEKQITHSLPLFQQQNQNITTSYMKHTNTQQQVDMIMSYSEILNSDFRSIAHQALNTILIQTSDTNNPVCYKFIQNNIITIMISLLHNEEGAIQSYACNILANMLCWEAYHKYYNLHNIDTKLTDEKRLLLQGALGALFHISIDDFRRLQSVSVAGQVSACGGLKLLTALLTSPTAAINIAHSSSLSGDTRESQQAGTGITLRRSQGTTSSIQGICNRQASRALIALLFPRMAVPLAIATCYHTTNCDLTTTSVTATIADTTVPIHLRSPVIGELFLEDVYPRPWQFTYFYKSGAVKDQFTAYLLFRNDHDYGNGKGTGEVQLYGRGVDSIGTFKLHGHAEADISGWCWYFNKSYISNTTQIEEGYEDYGGEGGERNIEREGMDSVDHIGMTTIRKERWLHSVSDDFNTNIHRDNNHSTRSTSIHVSHIAYWSGGIDCKFTHQNNQYHQYMQQKHQAATITTADTGSVENGLDFINEESSGLW